MRKLKCILAALALALAFSATAIAGDLQGPNGDTDPGEIHGPGKGVTHGPGSAGVTHGPGSAGVTHGPGTAGNTQGPGIASQFETGAKVLLVNLLARLF